MLSNLHIVNYAIIEKLDVRFDNGFTVITGETGAGKSILLGAISLILGNRVDTSVLNDKSKKCIIEGTFKLNQKKYSDFFLKEDIDFEEETIIRREISPQGKSRAFINDTPVTLNVIKDLSELLIDVHSQHQTLEVKDSGFQIKVVDSFANLAEELKSYRVEFNSYQSLLKDYNNLVLNDNQAKSDLDYITFQYEEINSLALKPNEQTELEEQLSIINSAEEIKSTLDFSVESLVNSNNNVVATFKHLQNSFSRIKHCSEDYNSIYERLSSLTIECDDISREIESLNDNFDFDLSQLEFINSRLASIYSLEQKHRLSHSDELLLLQKELGNKLNQLSNLDEEIKKVELELKNKELELTKMADAITKKRKASFIDLSKKVLSNLSNLGMPQASFNVSCEKTKKLNENGQDDIRFLFSANKGYELKELDKTASGGELSRLMLTIKSILNENNEIETILFDEIDTGVSGDVADKMGEIMKDMSNNIQIISITHLPQVAAKGNFHFKISKSSTKEKTTTSLSILSYDDRISELAKMLSGKDLTEAAIENAKNLITN